VEKRSEALDFIRLLQAADVDVYILSANWSCDLIFGALEGVIPDERIFANRHVYHPVTAVSTGVLDMHVVSAFDKCRVFKEIAQKTSDNDGHTETQKGLAMYVGDSPNDLLALLEADVPVVMQGNRYLLQSLNRLKVTVRQMTEKLNPPLPQDTIYEISEWRQVLYALRHS